MSAKKNLEISEIADAGKKSEIEISAALLSSIPINIGATNVTPLSDDARLLRARNPFPRLLRL